MFQAEPKSIVQYETAQRPKDMERRTRLEAHSCSLLRRRSRSAFAHRTHAARARETGVWIMIDKQAMYLKVAAVLGRAFHLQWALWLHTTAIFAWQRALSLLSFQRCWGSGSGENHASHPRLGLCGLKHAAHWTDTYMAHRAVGWGCAG